MRNQNGDLPAPSPSAPLVQAQDVTLQRDGRSLLQGVSFAVEAGKFVALVGANGAGKSTLMRAISGEWPSAGDVRLFGRPLASWRRRELARQMAVMSQRTELDFDFTVRETVALGRLPYDEPRGRTLEVVERILDETALRALAGRHVTSLSGGESQKVHYARAMAQLAGGQGARLLLLDEPTAALDLAQQKLLLESARLFSRRGNAVVAVLHDLNLAMHYADRALVLREGRLLADGDAETAMRQDVLTRAYGVAIEVSRLEDGRRVIVMA